ncbi:MAG: hypothetical protein Q8S57_00775 [Methanoregula sp.]|nr:hypothetical protein [Methanoregula sp.]
MDLVSVIAGLVLGVIIGWTICYLFEKQKSARVAAQSEQATRLAMQDKQAAEIKAREIEKRHVECCKKDLDKQSAYLEMQLRSTRDVLTRLSAKKDTLSAGYAILPEPQKNSMVQVDSIKKEISKVESRLSNLNVNGADYVSRREDLEKELFSLQVELSFQQEEPQPVPQTDLPAQNALQLRRNMEIAELLEQLNREICRIEESLVRLEMERGRIEQRREELADRIRCMQERSTGLAAGLQSDRGRETSGA